MAVTLDDIGKAGAQTLGVVEKAGFIEIDRAPAPRISVAPWHCRDV